MSLRSPIYQLEICGQKPVAASLAVNLPNGAALNETYDLYAWDGQHWNWQGAFLDTASSTVSAQVPSLPKQVALFQSTSLAPYVAAQIAPGQTLPTDSAALLNEMYLNGWTLADDGTIMAEAGDLPSTGTAKIIPVVRSLQAAPVRTMLSSEETVKAHIQDLTDLASRGNFAGVAIDYRGLPSDDRETFTKFVQQLAQSVHAKNKSLIVALPAPAIDDLEDPRLRPYKTRFFELRLLTLTYRGFLRMSGRHWRPGLGEMWRALNKGAFVRALQRLVPAIRAQMIAPDGGLVDDFLIQHTTLRRTFHTPEPYAGNPVIRSDDSSGILVDDGQRLRLYTMHPAVKLWLPRGAPALE